MGEASRSHWIGPVDEPAGDLERDTTVDGGDGSYRAVLSDGELWGPAGGYLSAIALRAAGAQSRFAKPVSYSCNYLRVAGFAPAEIDVVTLNAARRSEVIRVSMSQGGRLYLDATVCTVDDEPAGFEHDAAPMPELPGPAVLVEHRGADDRAGDRAVGGPRPGRSAPRRLVPARADAGRSSTLSRRGAFAPADRHDGVAGVHGWPNRSPALRRADDRAFGAVPSAGFKLGVVALRYRIADRGRRVDRKHRARLGRGRKPRGERRTAHALPPGAGVTRAAGLNPRVVASGRLQGV